MKISNSLDYTEWFEALLINLTQLLGEHDSFPVLFSFGCHCPWATLCIGLYGETPPERGTFVRLQVYQRVGISQV